ncbi:leucine-rich repeat protein [Tanacetum coccineum]
MENSKCRSIPMQEKLRLSKSQGASTPAELKHMQNVSYASAVGSIMYAVRCTCLDVAFAQNITSRFQQNPGDLHWTTVKNILKYLRNTKDMFLVYGGVVDWKSAKKSIFATSSAKAEYIAAYDASKEAVWVRKFISELGIVPNIEEPINILNDVATALDYLHNRCQTTIVHGDLKPSNILLDDDMVAHAGDFGLARLLGTNLNQNSSTGVKGTIGYAPSGIGSEMTCSGDVYSFGILLLELMTEKKPTDDMFIEGLCIHKFASVALPDHVLDVIEDDSIVLQSTEANAKKVEECLVATIKIGVSCFVDSLPQRMKTEIVVTKLQRILNV